MATRSAAASLAGYQYQFKKSVLEILNSPGPVILEQTEDIDRPDELIQCKYYANSKFVPSLLKQPLLEFLAHFAKSLTPPRYRLFGYYKDNPATPVVTLPELKSILGTAYAPLALTDAAAQTFLDDHLILDFGVSLEALRNSVKEALCKAFSCTPMECEHYFFNNALVEAYRLGRQVATADRTTTCTKFLDAINSKHILFPHWLATLKGVATYAKHIKDAIAGRTALSPSKFRWLILGDSLLLTAQDLALICLHVVEKYFRIGKDSRITKPFTIVAKCDQKTLGDLKLELLQRKCVFNDGFESLSFQSWAFNRLPIINVKLSPSGRSPTDTLGDASYVLRLIGYDTYKTHLADFISPDSAFVISDDSTLPIAKDCQSIFRLTDLKTIDDLFKCI